MCSLLMLSVWFLLDNRLFTVKFSGSQKLHADFYLHGCSPPLTPALFNDEPYRCFTIIKNMSPFSLRIFLPCPILRNVKERERESIGF